MAINKKSSFGEEVVRLADFAKALSHPARLEILKTLAERNSCICGEIVEVMPLSQSTVSQHLKELKRAGLVTGQIEGVKSCYCIDWEVMDGLVGNLENWFGRLSALKEAQCSQ